MVRQNDSPDMVSVLGPPAIVVISTLLFVLIPNEMRIILMVWTLASFPIGVLCGRCVLSEG